MACYSRKTVIEDLHSAEDFLFASYIKARPLLRGPDEHTRRPDLTARLLEALGQPENGLPCLLIAGSKGKGSTAAFAAGLLALGGAPVGLFTSPHLLSVRERIRVAGQAIPSDDFVRHVRRVAEAAEPWADSLPAGAYLSPIGLLLCVALLHFRANGVQIAVIEAGRGARFDDTRLVEHPVSIITRLMREHVRELGPGLERIGWHKAGAIGKGGTAVSAPQRPVALRTLQAEAVAQNSRLLLLGEQIRLRRHSDSSVDVVTEHGCYASLWPGLRGAHQAENLALAIAAAVAFWPGLVDAPLAAVREAVASVRWPGRCEVLQERPLVLLDGAINLATARAFLAAARPISSAPIVAIAGVPSNKDYAGLFRTIAPEVQRLYVTRASNPHLRFPSDAAAVAARYARDVVESPSVAAAVEQALNHLGSKGSLWIVGTQSLLADALRLWRREPE